MDGAVPPVRKSGHRFLCVAPPSPLSGTVWAGGRSLSTVDSGHALIKAWTNPLEAQLRVGVSSALRGLKVESSSALPDST